MGFYTDRLSSFPWTFNHKRTGSCKVRYNSSAVRIFRPGRTFTASADDKTDSADEEATRYTLQVGAFGSLDNATALQKRLGVRFREVSVRPVTLSEQVFYRVRIGTFNSKEAAEAFGADSLTSAGISYKAVVK